MPASNCQSCMYLGNSLIYFAAENNQHALVRCAEQSGQCLRVAGLAWRQLKDDYDRKCEPRSGLPNGDAQHAALCPASKEHPQQGLLARVSTYCFCRLTRRTAV